MSWWNPISWIRRRTFDVADRKDERSRNYPVRAILPPDAEPVSHIWNCPVWLDQGSEGACTGFAVAHELASEPVSAHLYNSLPDANFARALYHDAQKLDQWPGEDYEGSSVLGAMQAAQLRGFYDEYRWAFGIDDLVLAVGHLGPAVLGIDWHSGMQRPDWHGLIHVRGKRTGGHAICCIGYDANTERFLLHNSWGRWWGLQGNCWIAKSELEQLLNKGGVAAIPVTRRANGEK